MIHLNIVYVNCEYSRVRVAREKEKEGKVGWQDRAGGEVGGGRRKQSSRWVRGRSVLGPPPSALPLSLFPFLTTSPSSHLHPSHPIPISSPPPHGNPSQSSNSHHNYVSPLYQAIIIPSHRKNPSTLCYLPLLNSLIVIIVIIIIPSCR